MNSIDGGRVVFDSIIFKPVAPIISLHADAFTAVKVVARQERLIAFALSFKCLEFRSDIYSPVFIIANIERNDTDGVSCNEKFVVLFVVKYKGEDAAELFEQ